MPRPVRNHPLLIAKQNLHSETYLYAPKELPNEEVYYLKGKKNHHNKLEAMYMLLNTLRRPAHFIHIIRHFVARDAVSCRC